MKNKTLLYGLIAIGGYLLWKKYGKKSEVASLEGAVIGGTKLEIATLECKSEALVKFGNSKVSEEVIRAWTKSCIKTKLEQK